MKSFYLSFLLSGLVLAAQATETKPVPAGLTRKRFSTSRATSVEILPQAKVVPYRREDILRLKTKLRYTTLIVLPSREQITEVTCGDKEFWVVNAAQNLAYVKPAKAGAQSNLNLVTTSGNVYSFVLEEVSERRGVEGDLKVFVEPKEEPLATFSNGSPKFVPAQQVEDYQRQVEAAKAEAKTATQNAQRTMDHEINRFRAEYPSKLTFDYQFRAKRRPFCVTAMFHDDKFMYIRASPQEIPTLYEVKDGRPNLISFEYRDGAFVAPKILDRGYLMIGNQKLTFQRRQSHE